MVTSLDAEKIGSKQEERTAHVHQIDSINLLIFTTLLVIVVLTIWIFKRRNFRYLHETCLALVYGNLLPILSHSNLNFLLIRFYCWSYSSTYKYIKYKIEYI